MPKAVPKPKPAHRLRVRRVLVWVLLPTIAVAVFAGRTMRLDPVHMLPIPTSAVLRLATPSIFPSSTVSTTRTETHTPTLLPTLTQQVAAPTSPVTFLATSSATLTPQLTTPASPSPPSQFVAQSTGTPRSVSTAGKVAATTPLLSTRTAQNGANGGTVVSIAGGANGPSIGLGEQATKAPATKSPVAIRSTAAPPTIPAATWTLSQPSPIPSPSPTPPQVREPARLIRVIDGDTLEVAFKGQSERVRLIGVDSPETNKGPLCYGAEATEKARELLGASDGKVMLEKDVSERDRYGRLLRYVWLPGQGEPTMLNLEMAKQGYARAAAYPPDVKHQRHFEEVEKLARAQNLGLWGACSRFGAPLTAKTPPLVEMTPTEASPTPDAADQNPVGVAPPTPTLLYDPNGPDRDCSEFPTQADAQRFFIAAGGPERDPHRLDNDHDGIACESLP